MMRNSALAGAPRERSDRTADAPDWLAMHALHLTGVSPNRLAQLYRSVRR